MLLRRDQEQDVVEPGLRFMLPSHVTTDCNTLPRFAEGSISHLLWLSIMESIYLSIDHLQLPAASSCGRYPRNIIGTTPASTRTAWADGAAGSLNNISRHSMVRDLNRLSVKNRNGHQVIGQCFESRSSDVDLVQKIYLRQTDILVCKY